MSIRIAGIVAAKGAEVETIDSGSTVKAALAALDEKGIGALVVSPDGRKIEGIVSERDVVRALHREGVGILEGTVGSIMTVPVHTCGPDDTPEEAMERMTALRARHLPVIKDGVLVGLVSIGDIVKSRIEDLETDHKLLVDYIEAR